jgi:3-oxoacyl-[acyl-carrier protein] reductase
MVKTVLVTGGTRGLGLAIAQNLAAADYRPIAIARKPSSEAGAIPFVPFDLNDTAGIPGLVKRIREEFGPIYGLVNNAGISYEGVLSLLADDKIEQLIRVNITAPVLMSKYAVHAMLASGVGGRIVNVSSIAASNGFRGLSVYGATKASLIGFTKSLARDVGPAGITVNAIAPGFVATDLTAEMTAEQRTKIAHRSALRRLADAEDVANATEFLLSDRAKNITGTVITVDAGNTA